MAHSPHTSPSITSLSERVFSRIQLPDGGAAFPLHVGDTWRRPPQAALKAYQDAKEDASTFRYASVVGEPSLRQAAAEQLSLRAQATVAPTDVQVVSGATSGLSVICGALLDPGDEVLLPSPYWPLIRGIISARGATAVEVPLFDRLLDEDRATIRKTFQEHLSARTTAIYVNTPHNPTGRMLPPAAADALAELAQAHNLWVIADEAYEALWYSPEPPRPFWSRPELREQVIACHTVSKSFGMAGARVGYVHGAPAAMRAVRALQTFQTYCAAPALQRAAAAALCNGQQWLQESRELYAQAGRNTAQTLGLPAPEAGTFALFDGAPYLQRDEPDCTSLLQRCVDEAGVLMTPGAACGKHFARWARICFTSIAPDELDQALGRLRSVLDAATKGPAH